MWMATWAKPWVSVCREAFQPRRKQAAQKIVKEVEAAMQSEIQTLPWMSAATKEQALIKLHASPTRWLSRRLA